MLKGEMPAGWRGAKAVWVFVVAVELEKMRDIVSSVVQFHSILLELENV